MILEGKYPNMQAIQSSMDELGISFKGKCRICVLHIVNDNDELIYINDMLDIISSQVAARMPHVLWIIHNNELVLLFNIEKNADISDADYNFLYKLTKDNNISAGMSYEFYSLAGAGQLYWQAKQAAEFGHELLGKRLTKFEEVSHFSMFQLIQKNMDPMVYVDPGLMQLLNEGKENVHESFNTLYWYLKYGGNTNEVAAKTHMHRNTVLYRVDKLHQRMNFDLNNGISVMKLMLSFEILKYLKLFQPDE